MQWLQFNLLKAEWDIFSYSYKSYYATFVTQTIKVNKTMSYMRHLYITDDVIIKIMSTLFYKNHSELRLAVLNF